MKHLQEFINEQMKVYEAEESKTFTFDFTDLENAEETVESLKDKEGVSVEDNTVTVTVNSDNASKLDAVQDILKKFSDTIRNSTKRSSDEQYAQKTKTFADKVEEFNSAIDEINNPKEDE